MNEITVSDEDKERLNEISDKRLLDFLILHIKVIGVQPVFRIVQEVVRDLMQKKNNWEGMGDDGIVTQDEVLKINEHFEGNLLPIGERLLNYYLRAIQSGVLDETLREELQEKCFTN